MIRNLVLDYLSRCERIRVEIVQVGILFGDEDEFWRCLSELGKHGLIETWLYRETHCISLTALAARRFGLRPNSRSTRWLTANQREPREQVKHRIALATDVEVNPDNEPDERTLTPDKEAIHREEAEAKPVRRNGDYLSRKLWNPTHLIGATETWPLPGQLKDGVKPPRRKRPCSACGGLPLRSTDYCLACCRSGQDHLLRNVVPPANPKEESTEGTKVKRRRKAG